MSEQAPKKPTIAELEAIMERDDLELTILPSGEVRTQKRVTVHALEDIVEQTEPENERAWEFDDGSRWELGDSMAGGAHADSRTINGQMVPGFITMRIVSADGEEQEHMYILKDKPEGA